MLANSGMESEPALKRGLSWCPLKDVAPLKISEATDTSSTIGRRPPSQSHPGSSPTSPTSLCSTRPCASKKAFGEKSGQTQRFQGSTNCSTGCRGYTLHRAVHYAHFDLFAMCLSSCARFPSVAAASPAPLTSAPPPPPRQCPRCFLVFAQFTCVSPCSLLPLSCASLCLLLLLCVVALVRLCCHRGTTFHFGSPSPCFLPTLPLH